MRRSTQEASTAQYLLVRYLFIALAVFGIFQCFSVLYARRAAIKAVKLERVLEEVTAGKTTRSEVEQRFNNAGMTLREGACSPASCSAVYLIISNYPRFELSKHIALDHYLATMSVVQPAGISVDLYFTNDLLSRMGIFFGGDTGDHIQFQRWHREGRPSGEVISNWQKSSSTGTQYIAISIDEHGDPAYGSLARGFELGCISRIGRCSATQLWPAAPPPTKEQIY